LIDFGAVEDVMMNTVSALANERGRRHRSRISSLLLGLVACSAHDRSFAQWRTDQPPVVTPPPQHVLRASGVPEAFSASYKAAGRPRILLFWNSAFDGVTQLDRQTVQSTQRDDKQSSNSLHKQTNGSAGSAVLTEADTDSKASVTQVTTQRVIDSAIQPDLLSARNAAQLEMTFRQQLQEAGARLFDRATTLRFTQAGRDRAGVDGKLIETDTVLGKADLLLEILTVKDVDAPLGAGFKIVITDVKSGAELASLYTLARPELRQPTGHYIVTDIGFEWRQPSARAGVADVGISLSHQVMQLLSQRLAVVTK
jgi:hypothetical protein